MSTIYITHDAFLNHDTGEWHPELADRMTAIDQALTGDCAHPGRWRNDSGMACEAMNITGAMDQRLIIILNDNDMSIAPGGGALGFPAKGYETGREQDH